jgi:peptide deformylase
MGIRPIVHWPDPRLTTVCDPVGKVTAATRKLVQDMFETMYEAPGRGLAAPQVGVMQRIFVTDTTWKEGDRTPLVFINPEITDRATDLVTQEEGCLSIPGVLTPIARPAEVTLRWTDLEGMPREQRFTGFAAACVQHELDHLDGILTLDRLDPRQRAGIEAALSARP